MNTLQAPTAIDQAAHVLLLAKAKEEAAKAARIEAENVLAELVGSKPEGTTRHETAYFKITTTGKLNRKLDETAYAALAADIPDAVRVRLVRIRHDLNLAELRHLQNNEPELYARIAPAITVTPAKTAVTVETL